MYSTTKTKKAIREIERSRKQSDKESMDGLHSLAIAMDVEREHDRWVYRIKWLDRSIENKREEVAAFTKKINEAMENGYELAYEFRWADGPAASAASHDVLCKFKEVLLRCGPEVALRCATDEAMRGARDTSYSSGQSSNIVARAVMNEWARIVEEYRYL